MRKISPFADDSTVGFQDDENGEKPGQFESSLQEPGLSHAVSSRQCNIRTMTVAAL
jgi:hypothetical protein